MSFRTWILKSKDYFKQEDYFLSFTHVLGAVFLFGFLAHGYCFLNMTYSHDSLYYLVEPGYAAGSIALGRFMQALYLAIRGPVAIPWFIGVLSLLFLSMATHCLLKVLDVRAFVPSLLICAIMSTNIVVTLTNATYIHESDMYMLALALAIFSVRCFQEKNPSWFILGVVLLALSMGFYQAYISVAVVLFLALLIKNALLGGGFKECIATGLKMLGMIVCACALYYASMKLVAFTFGVALSSNYNGVADLGDYSNTSLTAAIAGAWKYTIAFFLKPIGMHTRFQLIANVILGVCALASLVLISKEKKPSLARISLIVFCLIIMPIGANVAYVASKGMEGMVHYLMLYGAIMFYLLCLVVTSSNTIVNSDSHWKKLFPVITWATCLALVFFNIVGANQAYLLKHLQSETTESVMTRVIDRLEQMDGYSLGETPVLFAGRMSHSPLFEQRNGFEGVEGTGFFANSSITYDINSYLKTFLGYPIKIVPADSVQNKVTLEDLDAMDPFPAKGSCKQFDDVVVVKLSDRYDKELVQALSQQEA